MTAAVASTPLQKIDQWLTTRENDSTIPIDLGIVQRALTELLLAEGCVTDRLLVVSDDLCGTEDGEIEFLPTQVRAICDTPTALRTMRVILEQFKLGNPPTRKSGCLYPTPSTHHFVLDKQSLLL